MEGGYVGRKGFALFKGVGILLIILWLSGCGSQPERPVVGRQAPNFAYLDLNGKTRELKELRGQVVFLNFWADWCAICVKEMPIIEKVYQDIKDKGFTVLAVNVQQGKERVEAHVRKWDLSYPVALDPDGKISEQYNVRGLPWNMVIDKRGILKELLVGEISEEMLRKFLEPYLL